MNSFSVQKIVDSVIWKLNILVNQLSNPGPRSLASVFQLLNSKLKLSTFFLIPLALSISPFSFAQISLSNGEHNLEISGSISSFYNQRFYYNQNPENRIDDNLANPINKDKDRFGLRDMQLQLEGRIGHDFEYEFQVDFADLANQSDLGENPGIMDANFTYKGLKFVNATLGYQKIPYSRNSLVPFTFSPYWQRAEVARGEIFSRRDVGIMLSESFWNQKINVYGGMFTGMGEQILSANGGDNDPSGEFEYVGRVDIAFPARYRYRDYDINSSPIPMFQLGAAARTVKRKYSSFLPGDDYYLRVISGQKDCFTADFSAQWKGFSTQVEWHLINVKPTNEIDPSGLRYRESRGTANTKIGANPTGFFRAGGILATVSYASKPLKSIFSIRYDQLNPNDLVQKNTEESLTFAYAYQLRGFNSMIKAQYSYRLIDRKNPLIQRFDDQLRVGWQMLLR